MTTEVAQDETLAAALLAEGRALMADPATAGRGMQCIVDAAHQGSGEASHLVSLLAAADGAAPDRWVYALAYLGRGAKAGHAPSQKTLAFLAGDEAALARLERGEAFGHADCHRLHDAIDIAAWTSASGERALSAAPRVSVAEDFIPGRVCDWIIARARPHLARAQVYDPRDGSGGDASIRTNSEMRFGFENLDLVLMFVTQRIAALTGLDARGMEPPSVLHYRTGQEFRPHHDYLDPAVPAYAAETARIGQRVATLLIYLNDGFDGGETHFPLTGLRFKGRKGDALLFHNVTPGDVPDPATLHAGLAPVRGEKWLFSQWIRRKPSKPA